MKCDVCGKKASYKYTVTFEITSSIAAINDIHLFVGGGLGDSGEIALEDYDVGEQSVIVTAAGGGELRLYAEIIDKSGHLGLEYLTVVEEEQYLAGSG